MLKELRELWDSLPGKLVLVVLLVAWWALFEFYGTAHLHWLLTPSLFTYMGRMLGYAVESGNDDQLGVWMPLLFLVLVVVRRRELKLSSPVRDRWIGVILLGLAAAAHAVFFSVQQVVLSSQAFLIGAYALTGIVWGREWLHRFFFPFVVLCFMMPIVHYLDAPTFWLRHFSAAAATWIGQNVLNIPLVRQATQVAAVDGKGIPIFTFDVVDACSGIRSLKVIILLTVVFGFLQFKTAWRRWLLLACAPFLAVTGNVVRLVTTFWVGDLFGQEAASKFETSFGYVTFAVAFGGLILLARLIRERDDPTASEDTTTLPDDRAPVQAPRPWIPPALAALAAMGLVAGLLHYRGPKQRLGLPGVKLSHDALLGGENAHLRTNGVIMPLRLTGFESIPVPIELEELRFLPGDTTFGRRLYRDEADRFDAVISVVVMGTDRSSLHRPEQCLGAQGVSITGRQTVRLPTSTGELEVLRCNGLTPNPGGRGSAQTRAVFAYLFVSSDHQTSSHSERHLLTMRDLVVRGEMPRWAGIQCFTRCREGEEDAIFEKMKRLLALAVPAMRAGVLGSGG